MTCQYIMLCMTPKTIKCAGREQSLERFYMWSKLSYPMLSRLLQSLKILGNAKAKSIVTHKDKEKSKHVKITKS
jgi:hypothetical protein